MLEDLKLPKGWVGSQCSYRLGKEEDEILKNLPITNLDMEANSIAQTCRGRDVPVMSVKLTSNGVHDDHVDQEFEYRDNKGKKAMLLKEALKKLEDILVWQEKNGIKKKESNQKDRKWKKELKKTQQENQDMKKKIEEMEKKLDILG